MFGWLKRDPVARLEKAYRDKIQQAMETQRAGDIPRFAELTAEAEELAEKLERAKRARAARA